VTVPLDAIAVDHAARRVVLERGAAPVERMGIVDRLFGGGRSS
jgi:hypothetical protein